MSAVDELQGLLAPPSLQQAPPAPSSRSSAVTELQSLLSQTTTPLPPGQSVLKQGSADDTQLPMETLRRKPGEPPKAFLSTLGSAQPRYMGNMPGEVEAPVPDFEPTTLFPEGRDKPASERYGYEQVGGAANTALDVAKGFIGGFADPENWTAAGIMSRMFTGQKALKASQAAAERARRHPPTETVPRTTSGEPGPGTHHEVLRLEAPKAPERRLPPSAQHALEPRPLGPGSPPPGTGMPTIGSSGPRVPVPPDPQERLGPDGTFTFNSASPTWDVFVSDWRDPNISYWEKLLRKAPADLRIAMYHPESPVIGFLDRPATKLMNWTDEWVHSAEMKDLQKLDRQLFVDEEAKAYAMWKPRDQTTPQIAPTGSSQLGPTILGRTGTEDVRYQPPDFDEIMRAIDPRVRPWFELFRERMKIDQQSRDILGLENLDEVPYPYLPRIAQEDWDRIMTLYRGDRQADAVSQLSTTLKGFQQSRTYDTMSDGMAKGVFYEDPKRAILMRYVLSKQLEFTAQMMQDLRGTVLFDTRAEAQGELYRRLGKVTPQVPPRGDGSTLPATTKPAPSPLEQPVVIRGMPGSKDKVYYVPSKAEALALHQHLRGHESTLFQSGAILNQFFRNPNLFNPMPHVVKNMGYKYVLAMVGLGHEPLSTLGSLGEYSLLHAPVEFLKKENPIALGRLSRDAAEYVHNTNPTLVAEFNAEMPFSLNAHTAYENLKPYLERNPIWKTAQLVGKYATGNAWSSEFIFSKADPAMKYSLWKAYRERGLSPTAAANQVNIDLVRYTLRSELTDTWKNVPLNFFVPWRTGTVMATAKQLSTQPWSMLAKQTATKIPTWAATRPFKTSALLGAFMIAREAYWRDSGTTMHLPFDYTEGPIMALLQNPATARSIVSSLYILGAMYYTGPGGDPVRVAGDIYNMLKVAQGSEDSTKLMEMYWGIAQIYGGAKAFQSFAESLDKHGVEGADYSLLAHMLGAAFLAEYETYSPKQKHFAQALIPEEWLPTNPAVAENVRVNKARQEAGAARAPFRGLKRDAIRQQQHEAVHPPDGAR